MINVVGDKVEDIDENIEGEDLNFDLEDSYEDSTTSRRCSQRME